MNSLAGMQVTLQARGYNTSSTFKIGTMSDPSDASTFTMITEQTGLTTSYQEFEYVIPVNCRDNFLAIMIDAASSSRTYNGAYIDDIVITEAPACTKPLGLEVVSTTTTSATLNWTASGNETAWQICLDGDETNLIDANSNPFTIEGLTAATSYTAKVRANCGDEDYSDWSNTVTIETLCDVVTITESWSENFNSLTAGIPNCWDNSEGTTTNASYMWSYYATGHNGAGLRFNSYSNSNGNTNFLKTPTLNFATGKVMQLRFWYKNPTGGDFSVFISTDGGSTYTTALATGLTGVSSWTQQEINLTNYVDAENVVIVFKGTSNYGSGDAYIYLDDVAIVEAPSCLNPTELAVTANGLTATLTWESEVGEYEVAHATEATANPDENIAGTATEETYTMNNLALVDHYFWVRANCGSDGYSEWVGPVSVHIGYCVPNPTSHDGSGITGVSFGMGDYVVENGGEGTSIPASAPYYGDYSNMIGAVQAGVESTIAITTGTGSYPYTFVIWVDFDNSLSFEDSEVVYVGKASTGAGTLNATITVPATQATGDYRMRIYGADSYFNSFYGNGTTNWEADHDPCSSGTYRHANDYTLRVLEAPSCMMPTDLAVNYTGGTEASISWTSDAEAWNMRVNGVDVNGVITNPYTLTGLELATTYSVEVQANCGEDGTSEWTNAVSFTTDLCMPENQCEISYSFYDQYDDSWNGAYMNIVDATTEEVLYELTMPEVDGPYEGSFNVCDGRDIQFVWVSGSYPNECGYEFTHNGETILEKGTGETAPEAGVVLTYTVDCGFASYTLEIEGVGEENWNNENNSGYYLIASPVNVDLTNHEMTTGDFDLYYFDQVGDEDGNEWMNYKNESFNLEPGKGYLYAHKIGGEFTLTGTAYDGDGTIELVYDDNATDFQGWNLVGNPWGEKAYPDHAFYTMAEGGAGIDVTPNVAGTEVAPMTGIFVVAEAANETVTFSTEAPANTDGKIALNVTNSNKLVDRAIVRFGEGRQLPKFQLNPNHTKVYIPMEGKDYAIVNATEMGEMPVNFKAEKSGSYSL
ncbi:MAG: fibronectin type III domain-containing protein, partial [Muribaculaceae bacterium]|nr:fibronectin type III domain-containing protein [Muribaculaceae bacterium]